MRKLVFLVALVVLLTVGLKPASAHTGYIVQPGDNLFGIAARFNVSISELATINHIYDVNAIYVGQYLMIPAPLPAPGGHYLPPPQYGPPPPPQYGYPGGTVITTTTTYIYYVVQPGDLLDYIAQRYGVTTHAILAANYIGNPNLIYVGQRLVIPKTSGYISLPPPRPVYGNIYVVQYGDNLFSIAARFHRDVYKIARANGILNLNHIYAGMALIIP